MRPLFWLAFACLAPAGLISGQEAPRRLEVVTPKLDGIIATGINSGGDLVGFEWVEDPKTPGVIGQEPFFARGSKQTWIPLLPTYTSNFPAAISDTGLVVGRVSKPGSQHGRVPLQNQAFIWTESEGIRGLGALPDDFASFASGVSRDGWMICGTSVGQERMRVCVWEREGSGTGLTWRGTPLPQIRPIASVNVAISGDGRYVTGLDGSSPTLWTRPGKSGDPWTREEIGPAGSINPRAVNNAATVVGITYPPDGSTHAVVWTRARGVQPIPEPPGYVKSEASAINNAGAIVGMIDGSHASPLPPRAFVFADGKLRILEEGGPNFAAATVVNDRGQVSGVFEAEEPAEPAPPSAKLADPKP